MEAEISKMIEEINMIGTCFGIVIFGGILILFIAASILSLVENLCNRKRGDTD